MNALVIAPQPVFSPRGTPYSVYYRMKTMADLGDEIDDLIQLVEIELKTEQ